MGGRSSPPSSTAPPMRMPVASGVMTKPWPPKTSWRRMSKAPRRQGGVVAALGLERDALAERVGEAAGEGAGGDHGGAGGEDAAVRERDGDGLGLGPERRGLGLDDLGAPSDDMIGEAAGEGIGVLDGLPFRARRCRRESAARGRAAGRRGARRGRARSRSRRRCAPASRARSRRVRPRSRRVPGMPSRRTMSARRAAAVIAAISRAARRMSAVCAAVLRAIRSGQPARQKRSSQGRIRGR